MAISLTLNNIGDLYRRWHIKKNWLASTNYGTVFFLLFLIKKMLFLAFLVSTVNMDRINLFFIIIISHIHLHMNYLT